MKKAARSGKSAKKPAPSPTAEGMAPRSAQVKHWISGDEMQRLRESLREAQETLEAIRNGEVDAVVVSGAHGNQVYSLAGAEQPYRVYVEQMQEGAVTVTEEGIVLYANQRFAGMAELPLERVIGSKILQYVPQQAWDQIRKVLAQEGVVVKHECLICEGGSGLPVNLTASRLPMEGPPILCLVVTDLTAFKESEQLRLAKEGAERASEAKDAFLAALSHELRTPLTPALMATMALEQDETLPEQARLTLGMIRRNVELEARLIDDLLDLTRISRGKMELHLRGMDVHAVIRRALEICDSDIYSKHQKLDLQLEASDVETIGDPVRLQQALWNVIRNAIKFTPEGGNITIRTGNHGARVVWVEVKDSGTGFAAGLLPSLFKPFEQGGREVTRRFGGLGLGLAISHSIMESHQGSIRGSSDGHGLGATFTLEIPLRDPESLNEKAPVKAPKSRVEQPGMRILLVEDHKDTRASMEQLLRRSKHHVRGVGNGADALAAAAEHSFDLVISDLGLPDISGVDLMRRLRDDFGLRGIAVSGFGMEDDLKRSLDAGFTHHLVKPVRMDHLRRIIAEMQGDELKSA